MTSDGGSAKDHPLCNTKTIALLGAGFGRNQMMARFP